MPSKILLFDDDFHTMEPFKNLLTAYGYEVELTAEVNITQRLIEEEFSLICVDLMIHLESPDQNGNVVKNLWYEGVKWQKTGGEFVRRLRRGDYQGEMGAGTSADVPIIIVSATGNTLEDSESYYVYEKPFDAVELLETIERLLGEQDAIRE
jgi:CheY-like chemotaxis protein